MFYLEGPRKKNISTTQFEILLVLSTHLLFKQNVSEGLCHQSFTC